MKTPNAMTNKPEVYSPEELSYKLKLSEKVIANHALQLGILVTTANAEQYVEVADIGKLLKALKKNYAQQLKVDGVGEKLEKLAEYALEQQAIAKAKEEARRLREAEEQQQKEQEQLRREEELRQVDPELGLPIKLLELTKAVLDPMNFHCGTFSFFRQLINVVQYNGEAQDFSGLHNYSGSKEDVRFSLSEKQKQVFFEYLSIVGESIDGLPETVRVIAAVDKWEVLLNVPVLEMWRLEGIRLKEERKLRLEAYTLQAQATAP